MPDAIADIKAIKNAWINLVRVRTINAGLELKLAARVLWSPLSMILDDSNSGIV